jgi:hypothetical protein
VVNITNVVGTASTKTIAVWPIKNEGSTGWGNIKDNTLFFDVKRYDVSVSAQPAEEQVFLAVNSEPRMVWYGRNINCIPLVVRIELGMMVERYGESILQVLESAYAVKNIVGALKLTQNGIEYYYDGSRWSTSYTEKTFSVNEEGIIEQEIQFGSLTGQGLLQLFIFSIDVEWRSGNSLMDKGYFLGVKAFNFSRVDSLPLLEKNAVHTKYNESNNVRLARQPSLVPAFNNVALPGIVKNGIYRKNGEVYTTTQGCAWPYDDGAEPMQLPAVIHKQLLCYHSKPNNLISGTIVNGDMLKARAIWTWKGKEHLLMSGSYNYLTGHIEGATLREFIRYEDLFNN